MGWTIPFFLLIISSFSSSSSIKVELQPTWHPNKRQKAPGHCQFGRDALPKNHKGNSIKMDSALRLHFPCVWTCWKATADQSLCLLIYQQPNRFSMSDHFSAHCTKMWGLSEMSVPFHTELSTAWWAVDQPSQRACTLLWCSNAMPRLSILLLRCKARALLFNFFLSKPEGKSNRLLPVWKPRTSDKHRHVCTILPLTLHWTKVWKDV